MENDKDDPGGPSTEGHTRNSKRSFWINPAGSSSILQFSYILSIFKKGIRKIWILIKFSHSSIICHSRILVQGMGIFPAQPNLFYYFLGGSAKSLEN